MARSLVNPAHYIDTLTKGQYRNGAGLPAADNSDRATVLNRSLTHADKDMPATCEASLNPAISFAFTRICNGKDLVIPFGLGGLPRFIKVIVLHLYYTIKPKK